LLRLISTRSPSGTSVRSEALSVTGTGHKLFELMRAHDLEGIVAKRLKDSYGSRVRWLKIKNPGYSQNEGRRELFDSTRRARAPSPPLRGAR
jgi:ATP-dependent DNA ligase